MAGSTEEDRPMTTPTNRPLAGLNNDRTRTWPGEGGTMMNRRSLKLTFIVALTILAQVSAVRLPGLAPSVAHAATSYTWTGQGFDGNWNTPKNWSPNGVPGAGGAGDSVAIGPA